MKQSLRKIFSPILNLFELGTEEYAYKSSHRTILTAVGCMFSGLAIVVMFLSKGEDAGYLFPVLIFGGAGLMCLIVSLLGTDRAVAKIWGSH